MAEWKTSNYVRGNRHSTITEYVGRSFNPDKYVFHLLTMLCLTFVLLYSVGTSIPAWYVLEERVQNVSACPSVDMYVTSHLQRSWEKEPTSVQLSASLWYLKVRLENTKHTYSRFIPFVFVNRDRLLERMGQGVTVESVFPKCLSSVLTFAFLALGVTFSFCASNRPSRLVYYGLSSVMIVSAISCWVTVALGNSEQYLLSAAFDLCIRKGAVKTSFLLQMVTGSCGLLAFTFGCILIHIAIMINAKVLAQNRLGLDSDCGRSSDLAEKVNLVLSEPNSLSDKKMPLYDV